MFGNVLHFATDILTIFSLGSVVLAVRGLYRRTIGSRTALANQMAKLSCDIRTEFVDQVLGMTPTFLRTSGNLTERVYSTPHAYIQTVADLDGSIVWWAVTTIDRRFKPRITLPPMSSDGRRWSVQLGATRFAQLDEPTFIRWFIGARRYGYAEGYYFGNPGSYLTYVVSRSDSSGVGESTFDGHHALALRTHADSELPSGESIIERPKDLDAATLTPMTIIRQGTTINTFGVGSSRIDLKRFPWTIGADSDQVRLLHAITVSHPGWRKGLLFLVPNCARVSRIPHRVRAWRMQVRRRQPG